MSRPVNFLAMADSTATGCCKKWPEELSLGTAVQILQDTVVGFGRVVLEMADHNRAVLTDSSQTDRQFHVIVADVLRFHRLDPKPERLWSRHRWSVTAWFMTELQVSSVFATTLV